MAELSKDWIAQECPHCGARLIIAPGATHFKCNYCDSSFERDPNVVVDYPNRKDFPDDKTAEEKRIEMLKDSLDKARAEAREAKDQGIIKDRTAKFIVIAVMSPFLLGVFLFFLLVFVGMVAGIGDSSDYSRSYDYDDYYESGSESKQLIEIDPFDTLQLSYKGISGSAWISTSDTHSYYGVSGFKIDNNGHFKNGDTFTVTCEYYDSTVRNYGYKLKCTTRQYTVSGLPEYISDFDSLSQEYKDKFKKYAVEKIVPSNLTHQGTFYNDTLSDIEYCGWIARVKKDLSDGDIFLVYSIKWDRAGTIHDMYVTARFRDTVVTADGDVTASWEPSMTSDYKTVNLGGSLSDAYGFASLDSVKDFLVTNSKSEWVVDSSFIK